MQLYRLTTQFWGKDLDEKAYLGIVVAKDDDEVYEIVNRTYYSGDWPDCVDMTREDIIAAKGDYESEYMGEFYDQKYGWEDLGPISDEDAEKLKALRLTEIIPE